MNGSLGHLGNGGGNGSGYWPEAIRRMEPNPGTLNCQDMPDHLWERRDFDDRCYFYPARDCPRMERGTICARINRRIPTITQETAEWSHE